MRRVLLTVLALLGVVCALVVTASSTMRQAAAAGMQGQVPLALVGLLEVVNIAGTWTWITDGRTRVRVEAAVGVAAASSVTAVCGALTYGALGVAAPVGLLVAVHLVSRMWSTPAPPPAVPVIAEPEPVAVAAGPDRRRAGDAVPGRRPDPGQPQRGHARDRRRHGPGRPPA